MIYSTYIKEYGVKEHKTVVETPNRHKHVWYSEYFICWNCSTNLPGQHTEYKTQPEMLSYPLYSDSLISIN